MWRPPGVVPPRSCRSREWSSSRREANVSEQASQDSRGGEVLYGNTPRGSTVLRVVALDMLRAGDRLLQRREGDESHPARQLSGEPGVLDQGRFAGAQITHGAIAEPATVGLDIDPLGHGALRPRSLYVAPKEVRCAGYQLGIDHAPLVLIQERQVFFVRGMDIKRQLEGARRQFWQANEFAKLMGLESERRALMLERTVWTTPACHRREALRRT